jgi:RNA polymerase sigma-70 factor, ECF subfamily
VGINKLRDGKKEQIFAELIDEKLPMLRRVVYRIVFNEADTDDVIQTALLKAWKNFGSYREQSQFSSWICRIACNQAYDLFRKRQRENGKLELFRIDKSTIEDKSAAIEKFAAVEQAMKQLPEKLHAALSLTTLEEMSPDEAAEILGCSTGTVYWRIHKARKILKKTLANSCQLEANYDER